MRIRLDDLNPPQRAAVTTTDGPLLVLAGAGSGKTRVITYRVAHLLERGVRPEHILAVSFTNKAADEMRERVERLCSPAQARMVTLSTFHALGLTMLKAEQAALGMPSGFNVYDTADQLGVVREILRDARLADRRLEVKSILSRISRCKNAGLTPESFITQLKRARHVNEYDGYTAEVYPRYAARMRALFALDFDDLLVETLRLLRDNERVRGRWQSRFRYLMIDEYQDTNRCQLELLRLLCAGHGNLAVVGDDDQSIYAWRGAESRNILRFGEEFPGARIIKLEENYRSTSVILEAANAVICKNTDRHGKTLWTSKKGGEPIQLVTAPDEHTEAAFVAAEIDILQGQRRIDLRDIAILYRAAKQAEPIEEALRQARIDYHVIGGTEFFERKEVKDALAYTKLLCFPHDELALRRVINYPPRGLGPTTMERITAGHRAAAAAARKQHRELSLWQYLLALVHKHGTQGGLFSAPLAASMPSEVEGAAHIADGEPLPDRVMAALARFVDTVQHYRAEVQKTPSPKLSELGDRYLRDMGVNDDLVRAGPTPLMAERRLRNLRGFLDGMQRSADRAGPDFDLLGYVNRLALSNRDDDADDGLRDAVTLSTLHGAKGLEFRAVFFIGLEEGLLPHKRSLFPREADQTLAGRRLEDEDEPRPARGTLDEGEREGSPLDDLAEERRLCYVGITRARERLYISYARQRDARLELREPSRFLDDLPPECLHLRDLESGVSSGAPSDLNNEAEEERFGLESLAKIKAQIGL